MSELTSLHSVSPRSTCLLLRTRIVGDQLFIDRWIKLIVSAFDHVCMIICERIVRTQQIEYQLSSDLTCSLGMHDMSVFFFNQYQ